MDGVTSLSLELIEPDTSDVSSIRMAKLMMREAGDRSSGHCFSEQVRLPVVIAATPETLQHTP